MKKTNGIRRLIFIVIPYYTFFFAALITTIYFCSKIPIVKKFLSVFENEYDLGIIFASLYLLFLGFQKKVIPFIMNFYFEEKLVPNNKNTERFYFYHTIVASTFLPVIYFAIYAFLYYTDSDFPGMSTKIQHLFIVFCIISTLTYLNTIKKSVKKRMLELGDKEKRKIELFGENYNELSENPRYSEGLEFLKTAEDLYFHEVINDVTLKLCDNAITCGVLNAYRTRALILTDLDYFSDALKDLEKAIELFPSDYLLYCKSAICKGEFFDYDNAYNDLSRAIKQVEEDSINNPKLVLSKGRNGRSAALGLCTTIKKRLICNEQELIDYKISKFKGRSRNK